MWLFVKMAFAKSLMTDVLLFAQEGTVESAPPVAPPGQEGIWPLVPPLVFGGLLFYLMLVRPAQKENRRRQELLETLKKNDKVLTIGGIIGTIVDFSQDGQRVTLRVDDGTRIKFTRSSIQGPYKDGSDGEDSKS